ncbi:ribosomal protein S20 [Actinomadura pelletieri DSM 43383]|uniref:Small ribosomal subunit protein bS20 n=1 Tax=Actinomadura pelletieri DSM 43383 TaxID=1120940 RepID=A0A495QPE1_9ACTN|nr:ribosomal protein S20 [Actinomadura pelletieri DSM 43383]
MIGRLCDCVWRSVVPRGHRPAPVQTFVRACAEQASIATKLRHYDVANIKSQIKRNKQNEKARLRNKAVKSELKTAIRKFREAADEGRVEDAVALQRHAARKLDKAVSKGVIHKNQAANRKSAIAKRAAALEAK